MSDYTPDNLENLTEAELSKVFSLDVDSRDTNSYCISDNLTKLSPDWSIRQCQGGNYEVSLYFLGRNREGSIRSWSRSMKSAMMIAAIRAERLGKENL